MRLIGLIAMAGITALLVSAPTSAIDPENMTEADIRLVSNRCRDIKRTLQSVQYVDALSRVNRGNTTSNLIRLMSDLNSRAASNTYNIPSMVTATKNIQDLRSEFARDYTEYEGSFRDLLAKDCSEDPEGFYKGLVALRAKRELMRITLAEIEGQLDIYSNQSLELLTQIKG